MITGLRPEQLAAADPALRRRLKEALRLGELMAIDAHKLSEIHFAAPERVVLYTIAYPMALHMGWGDWDDKILRVKRVLSLWKGQEEAASVAGRELSRPGRDPRQRGAAEPMTEVGLESHDEETHHRSRLGYRHFESRGRDR